VGGKLAQLGSRIIDGFAKKMADQFFENFRDAVTETDETDTVADENDAETPPAKKGWFKKIIS